MSSKSFPKIDQKEYLKKYLSGDKKKKDKKHKKSSKDKIRVKIIDDDVHHLDDGPQVDEELLLTGDDAPQIVGEYIEEFPADQKLPKWKTIVIKDEPEENECRPSKTQEEELWGRKASEVRIKKEFSAREKRSNRTPDNSPRRRKRKSSASPTTRQRKSPSPATTSKKDKNRNVNASPDRKPKIKSDPLSPLQQQSYSRDASVSRRRRNSDQSPPRRKQDNSPTRNGRYAELSPLSRERNPLGKRNFQKSDNSPPRRRRNSSHTPPKSNGYVSRTSDNWLQRNSKNSDQSPIRKNKGSDFHSTIRHKQKNDERHKYRERRNSDQSPPRSTKHSTYSSPPRTSKPRSDTPDYSPPRKNRKATDLSPSRSRRNSDQSPPKKSRIALDPSPPHRKRNSDQSSPRRNRKTADPSPPRRRRSSDQSPPRKSRKATDPSPPRRGGNADQSPPRRKSKQESEKSQSPPPTHKPKPGKTLEGKKAGLQNAQALQKETKERRLQEDILYETMSSGISGRNAEVQVRSTGRKGRRAREAVEEDPEERRRKDEYEEKKKQQYDRWGKGLKQIEDHKNRMLQQEYESSKPLARYADDEDLERHLREQERAEDPMLEYMRQKRKEKEKQSGKPEIPRYNGPFPENRFGIRPGYRWDGVDRSNGYEKKYFDVQNEKRARQDEAYKYSVEDM